MHRNLLIIVVLAVVPHPLWETCSPVFGMDPPPAWVFTNLGAMDPDPGEGITRPYAINDAGEIVGNSLVFASPQSSPAWYVPFHWIYGSNHGAATTPHNPEMLALVQLGSMEGKALDINNTGEIVGNTWPINGSGESATYWRDGTMTVLSSNSEAYVINDNGRVFGHARSGAGVLPAEFFLSSGPTVLLGPPEWFDTGSSSARGVNSLDQVVGTANHALYGESAFFWDQGQAISLQPSASTTPRSDSFDINDFGDVIGRFDFAGGKAPVVWNGPIPTYDGYEIIDSSYQLNTPSVNAINNNRWVVGKKGSNAKLWYKNQAGFWQGNGLNCGNSDTTLKVANDINNAGQVVGTGTLASDSSTGLGFLCSPDWNTNGLADAFEIRDGLVQDCNGNYIPDDVDISSGNSLDTNGNGIPDECETVCVGNDVDYVGFAECLAGPGTTPPTSTTTGCGCVATFDFDGDGYVDLRDFGAFQQVSAP